VDAEAPRHKRREFPAEHRHFHDSSPRAAVPST
jgi:hypothetical protein